MSPCPNLFVTRLGTRKAVDAVVVALASGNLPSEVDISQVDTPDRHCKRKARGFQQGILSIFGTCMMLSLMVMAFFGK